MAGQAASEALHPYSNTQMRAQVCVATVALLVGSIMAGQAASVLAAGWRLLAAVAALHAGAPCSC